MSVDTTLEDAFRAGLQRRADDVDTAVDLLGPARSAARGRRRRTWVAGSAGLAAAALVGAVVVQDVGTDNGEDTGTTVADGPSTPLPTEWRTEAWHGLQVEVPADWGWGAAPVDTLGDSIRCGGPYDGTSYVGRPVSATDVCSMTKHDETTSPYVWLGADLAPGTEDLENGFVQTTVEVDGTTLTVAADDPRLTQRILDSAAPVTGCAASLPSAPTVDMMLMEGLRDPSSAQVCAYRKDEGGSAFDLVYATVLDPEAAATYHSEVYDGGRESSPEFCRSSLEERVLVTIAGDDPYGASDVTQATVVDPFCREVSGSPGMVTPLSDEGMAAWSSNGAAVTLYGLIGPQG
jgi:hypothetical protein